MMALLDSRWAFHAEPYHGGNLDDEFDFEAFASRQRREVAGLIRTAL
jgi:hypothetical protein